jgi:hypothetical protein
MNAVHSILSNCDEFCVPFLNGYEKAQMTIFCDNLEKYFVVLSFLEKNSNIFFKKNLITLSWLSYSIII